MFSLLAIGLIAMSPHTARQRPVGSTVTVEGYVTLQSGLYQAFMGDNGFVIGNAVTGIYVATDKASYHSLGTALEVRGTLQDSGHGLLVLRPREVNLAKGRSLVRPVKVAPEDVGEHHEGRIIEVQGEMTRSPERLAGGTRFFVRGAHQEVRVFVPDAVTVDTALLNPGQTLRVTGWCAQHDRDYQIVVRNKKDIKPAK